MEEGKTLLDEAGDRYDASDRLVDFTGGEGETALICESDPTTREKICESLREQGYQVTAPGTAKEALKAMRFHVFDLIVLNEHFDAAAPQTTDVLTHLESMPMTTRRRFFVSLVSERYRTLDNMAAFNRSVNLVINPENLIDIGKIIKQGVSDNRAFYHIFQETLLKMGKG